MYQCSLTKVIQSELTLELVNNSRYTWGRDHNCDSRHRYLRPEGHNIPRDRSRKPSRKRWRNAGSGSIRWGIGRGYRGADYRRSAEASRYWQKSPATRYRFWKADRWGKSRRQKQSRESSLILCNSFRYQ